MQGPTKSTRVWIKQFIVVKRRTIFVTFWRRRRHGTKSYRPFGRDKPMKKKIKIISGPSWINVRDFERKFSLDAGRGILRGCVDLVLAAVLDARRVPTHGLASAVEALALTTPKNVRKDPHKVCIHCVPSFYGWIAWLLAKQQTKNSEYILQFVWN